MNNSFGKRFTELRKNKKMTQEEVAEKLGVSPQAVSKWENDISYPDVTLLLEIAQMFDTTVDFLLGKENVAETLLIPEEKRKDPNLMLLKIRVSTQDGDKVKVNIPLAIAKILIASDNSNFTFGDKSISLKDIDFEQLLSMIDQGVIGKLAELETAEGDIVEIYVE